MISDFLKHKETALIARFGIVGIICSVVFIVVFTILTKLSVQYQLASAISYISGTVTSYFLNKLWTFKSDKPHTFTDILLFTLVYLTALMVNLGVITLLVAKFQFNKYIAQVFAIGVSAVFSYLGNRVFVFKHA